MRSNFVRLLAVTCFSLSAPLCLAQTSNPQYDVRELDPSPGSRIKRYITAGSQIPINRRYDELSPEEKATVNKYYEKIEPGDEPPFPLEGLHEIHTAIARAQSKLLVTGQLTLVASIGIDGKVTAVKVLASPSPEMTKFAASVILLSRFKPAVCQGQPCKMDFPFSFGFLVE